MIKACLFDFDYTLVDSSPSIVHCFHYAFDQEGLPRPDVAIIKKNIGMPLEGMIKAMYDQADEATIARLRAFYFEEADRVQVAMTYFFPDTRVVMEKIKEDGLLTGIVSTKFRYRIVDALKANEMEPFFDLIVGGEDVTKHKPDPEGILIALERLQLKAEEVVFVGDSQFDYFAAKNADVKFIAVLNGETKAEEFMAYGCPEADIVSNLTALEKRLCQK